MILKVGGMEYFRFKSKGIPSASHHTQSLFQVNNSDSSSQFGLQLFYPSESIATSSGVYDNYGELRFILSGSQGHTTSSAIFAPFFTGGFWDVKLDRSPAGQNLNDSGSNDIT